MKILGIDIGTTTVSAVVLEDGVVLKAVTKKNDSFITDSQPWERVQDPIVIRDIALASVEELFAEYPDIERIGLTGQMHGIVYLDRNGVPLSPLYTWQDGRGELMYDEKSTYVSHLSDLTGYPLATGFGLVTHFYNLKNGLVPADAVVFCTIHDYIAMLLAGRSSPVTDASDAASFGLFNVENGIFDEPAIKKAGIDPAILPVISAPEPIGFYRGRAAVYPAIGDNQASFLGSCGGDVNCMLANIGTGGQFSVYTKDYISCPGLETRPFPGGGYLIVGSSLCGGRAYAILEEFFRMTAKMLGIEADSCYQAMENLLDNGGIPDDIPKVTPLFSGTREDPTLRGSISGLSTENLTPLHLIRGMLDGMADELYRMYGKYLSAGGSPSKLIGSGNGLRKNPHLRRCFSEKFGQELAMSPCTEEAASGAAIFAAHNL